MGSYSHIYFVIIFLWLVIHIEGKLGGFYGSRCGGA